MAPRVYRLWSAAIFKYNLSLNTYAFRFSFGINLTGALPEKPLLLERRVARITTESSASEFILVSLELTRPSHPTELVANRYAAW